MEESHQVQEKGNDDKERTDLRTAIRTFDYPTTPQKNLNLRNDPKVSLITNLFPIQYIDSIHKIFLYSIEISPQIPDDNSILKRSIYHRVESLLPEEFKKIIFSGNNLYTCITNQNNKDLSYIECSTSEKNVDYKVKLTKIKDINFDEISNNKDNENQEIKTIVEKLIRFIIMRNPKIIKFRDGTIVNYSDTGNIQSINTDKGDDTVEKIYKGYMTSIQITDNGFFMRINDINKIISGKTAYKKIMEIRAFNKEKSNLELRDVINDYFQDHRTVLTKYGNFRSYKIKTINFDKNPSNTSINIKDVNGNYSSVSLVNYYKTQYNMKISDESQPLIEVERLKRKGENTDTETETIYLIPEFVYLTGLEESSVNNDNNTRRKISSKTKLRPVDRINAIQGFNNLLNSTINKTYKNREGKEITIKSAKEIKDLYGINIGNNLTINGRLIPQPHLIFNKGQKSVIPNNGNFRSENPNKVIMFTNENLFYVYDIKEKNDCLSLFRNIMVKCRTKKFIFSDNFNPNNVKGYCLQKANSWRDTINELKKTFPENHQHKFGFVFLSRNMEKFYSQLKNFFINSLNLITQFGITKKLVDQKRGNTIQFNLLEQFNIKIGGENHYINFVKENLMKESDVFLIIGLKSIPERKSGKIKYCMTASKNRFLNCIDTSIKECDDNKTAKCELLKKMFKDAINKIMTSSKRVPNYIILYRKGGNYIQNIKLAIDEKDNFISVIKDLENTMKAKENKDIKIPFYYICCNLKTDTKFFEYNNTGNKSYANPKSGLIVDENIIQRNRFEFYIQPQFVNQGTATPCHYQIMCSYQHSDEILKLEQLERITFYLCYYYFTWAGAIREPGTLKMAETALDFSSKCLSENNMLNYFFPTPIYV